METCSSRAEEEMAMVVDGTFSSKVEVVIEMVEEETCSNRAEV